MIKKICIIGLGSMGIRRAKLIKAIDETIEIIGIDLNEERKNNALSEHEIIGFSHISEVENVDAFFVCTSPISHGAIIQECLEYGAHIFTEINLVKDNYLTNIELAKQKNKVLFLSSTQLYKQEIQKIQEIVNSDTKANYNYYVGQYLPDWHPWENFKDFFVGNYKTNGIREILAIELPWLFTVFGDFEIISSVSNKITDLDLGYNDSLSVIIRHKNGSIGNLNFDLVSRIGKRRLEVVSEDFNIYWEGQPKTFEIYESNSQKSVKPFTNLKVEQDNNYNKFIIEDAYKNEIIDFFNTIKNNTKQQYDFESDYHILKQIDQIETISKLIGE